MKYVCSSCRCELGRFCDDKVKPILFMCPHSHQVSTAVPKGMCT